MNIDMKNFFNQMFKDVAIDLGTSSTLIYVRNKGIVLEEPSTITIDNRTKKILKIGEEAKKTIGKTPANVSTLNPIESGVISDFEIVKKMLSLFIKEIKKEEKEKGIALPTFFLRIFISVPSGLSAAEKKIVYDTVKGVGAWKVYIIPESIGIAVGAHLPLEKAEGHFIIDIGAGLTDIAVVSLNGVVQSKSLNIAGNQFDQDIISYIKSKYNILIGKQTAENIKIELGSVLPILKSLKSPASRSVKLKRTMVIKGKDLNDRTTVKEVIVKEEEITKAIEYSIKKIIEEVKSQLDNVPEELVSDIVKSGLYLTGGGALLKGLDQLIAIETKIPVKILDDPKTALIRGMGIIMESTEKLKNLTEKFK